MIDKIKGMSDIELVRFINNMSSKKQILCIKCGEPIGFDKRKTINVGIYNKKTGQKVKKLCTLCNECYIDLLDYIGISDIEWEE